MLPSLEELREAGLLGAVDVAFARTLGALVGEDRPAVLAAAALTSRAVTGASVCLDLDEIGGAVIPGGDAEGEDGVLREWPHAAAWLAELRASPLVADAAATEPAPLVLDGSRLYLERYWHYERQVAEFLCERAQAGETVAAEWLRAGLDRLGLPATPERLNAQRLAAALALTRRLCVISGGPGTGKTYTVAKILALLVQHGIETQGRPPRIALLAPTGKAAARMSESIRRELPGLDCDAAVRAAIPTEAATIHRHLGIAPEPRRRAAPSPALATDAVIVDEVSMVDVGLLAKLLERLPAAARVILLGDPNQLASVEAGTVLADLCAPPGFGYSASLAAALEPVVGAPLPRAAASAPAIADGMVELTENRRFSRHPGIGALAAAIHAGAADRVVEVLRGSDPGEVEWVEPKQGGDVSGWQRKVTAALVARATEHFAGLIAEADVAKRITALERFRILSAHRDGSLGVREINQAVERELVRSGNIATAAGGSYIGRPILIERNDYQAGLFNGDLGLLVDRGGHPAAAFPGADGVREIAVSRLPPHVTVFAMTVHKSQGSEFDEIAVVLPAERSQVLSRELLYTAVTRARARVRIYATEAVLRAAVETRIRRASGLRQRLWGEARAGTA